MSDRIKNIEEVVRDKQKSVMEGVAIWSAFYRLNPHRFAKDFLNLDLRLFQKILLYAMMVFNYFIYIAARG